MKTVLDPRSQMSGTSIFITLGGPFGGSASTPVLDDSLNAEPDWVGALVGSREFRSDSKYAAFWEYIGRMAYDIKAAFREDEVPPPIAAYFRRLDR